MLGLVNWLGDQRACIFLYRKDKLFYLLLHGFVLKCLFLFKFYMVRFFSLSLSEVVAHFVLPNLRSYLSNVGSGFKWMDVCLSQHHLVSFLIFFFDQSPIFQVSIQVSYHQEFSLPIYLHSKFSYCPIMKVKQRWIWMVPISEPIIDGYFQIQNCMWDKN